MLNIRIIIKVVASLLVILVLSISTIGFLVPVGVYLLFLHKEWSKKVLKSNHPVLDTVTADGWPWEERVEIIVRMAVTLKSI